jgi:hypothetical protein
VAAEFENLTDILFGRFQHARVRFGPALFGQEAPPDLAISSMTSINMKTINRKTRHVENPRQPAKPLI